MEKLRDRGIRRPIRLLRNLTTPESREEWREYLGLSAVEFNTVVNEAELLSFKGIGVAHGRLLQSIGIQRVEELRAHEPESLYRQIIQVADHSGLPRPPRLDMIRVWVLAARHDGILLNAATAGTQG
jgi:hypothetical protein